MTDRARTRSTGLAGVTNLSVLAPLRTAMVPGIEPISYVGRLRRVLKALQASRENLRESEPVAVFPDVVGRFGIIHGFRYALVPPVAEPGVTLPELGTWRLSLNVTFDGGWEPYMRVIQRDIGPLLDLLFCHSPTYRNSRKASFEAYCDWVRQHEVPAGLFYADSASTVGDSHYLAKLEALQRTGGSDDALARCQEPSAPQQLAEAQAMAWRDPDRALAVPLRTLKGLYRLSTYFPPASASEPREVSDEEVLRFFAQDALSGPIEVMRRIEAATLPAELPPKLAALKEKWERIKHKLLPDELDWLQWTSKAQVDPKPDASVTPGLLQAHVLGTGEQMTHACLVLLQVKDSGLARTWIAAQAMHCGPVVKEGDIGYLLGFTYAGLQKLEVMPNLLAALPQEFLEGMEARSGLLGDLRSNHPDRWTRPLLHPGKNESGQRADLHAVDLVVQMRLRDKTNEDVEHPLLVAQVDALTLPQAKTGLRMLAVEPMRSYRDKKGFHAVGHLGIADGVSQPQLPTGTPQEAAHYSDQVRAGELLLGHANERDLAAPEPSDPFFLNGSFLAVRKLRQFMDRLDAVAPPATAQGQALLAKMVGRAADGTPLHGLPAGFKHANDFRFDSPAASDACPVHSHIRRTNPRDGRRYTPRILRRGMSWGPRSDTDRSKPRGVMFMAYCASLSEQFETVQRWVAGGNASGVSSAQGDPLLRVPKEGETYTFRYLDNGSVQRVEFSDQPLVQLQWGVYAFVPSLETLKNFATFTATPASAQKPPPEPTPSDPQIQAVKQAATDLEATRALLEDRDKSELVWRRVRAGSELAPQNGAYGKLLGSLDEVLAALQDGKTNGAENKATTYSVCGYGERMKGTIGLNLLGMDPDHPRRQKELPVKAVIAAFREAQAFEDAMAVAGDVLTKVLKFTRLPGAADDNVARYPIDLVDFSKQVLARLCTEWFGLPDEKHVFEGGYRAGKPVDKPLCPGSLGPASRYMFMPHPQDNLKDDGVAHATAILAGIRQWLDSRRDAHGRPDLTAYPFSMDIQLALENTKSEAFLAENIAGTMLGFTPSVQSNFLRAMETWIDEDQSLWLLQQDLFEQLPNGGVATYAAARAALRDPLAKALRKHPVPTMAWRSPIGPDGKPDTSPEKRVVLGLQSAMTDDRAQDELVFGRHHGEDGKDTTVHGCPGYELAMGVMLALIASLMDRGTLRPTGSPVLLILTLQPPPPPLFPPAPSPEPAEAAAVPATLPPAPDATPSASA